jgi:hypothetical protein
LYMHSTSISTVWFALPMVLFWLPPQLSIWHNVKPKYIKNLSNALPYKYLQVPCNTVCKLSTFCTHI